jgi:hypothetical protein
MGGLSRWKCSRLLRMSHLLGLRGRYPRVKQPCDSFPRALRLECIATGGFIKTESYLGTEYVLIYCQQPWQTGGHGSLPLFATGKGVDPEGASSLSATLLISGRACRPPPSLTFRPRQANIEDIAAFMPGKLFVFVPGHTNSVLACPLPCFLPFSACFLLPTKIKQVRLCIDDITLVLLNARDEREGRFALPPSIKCKVAQNPEAMDACCAAHACRKSYPNPE